MRPSLKQATWTLIAFLSFVTIIGVVRVSSSQFGETIPFRPTKPIARAISEADLVCLTDNIYHEARGESHAGKVAVAQVTLNRSRLQSKSICAIVYQPGQFSWVNKAKAAVKSSHVWQEARQVAKGVLQGKFFIKELAHATFYHATYIQPPYWAWTKIVLMEIGRHRFYA